MKEPFFVKEPFSVKATTNGFCERGVGVAREVSVLRESV